MTAADAVGARPSGLVLRRGTRRMAGRDLFLRSHVLLAALSLVCAFPIYWMFVTAFRPEADIYSTALLPATMSLEHFRYVLKAIPIGTMLANTVIVSAVATVSQVLTGLMAAYAFALWRRGLGRWMFLLLTVTWLIPPQVIMIPNFVLVNRLGLLDTLAAVILPHVASAFAIMLLYQAIRSFPKELIESAQMDGSGHFRILFGIIAPNIKPVLASVSIILFITMWNEYFWPLLVTRSMNNAVAQIGLQMFMSQEGNQWGALMAAATIGSLPILAMYLVLQRQIIDTFVRSGIR
jgi:ABC-type glycerol-3-phosphate transport system permease component